MLGSDRPTQESSGVNKAFIDAVMSSAIEDKKREHGAALLILLGRGVWWFVAALILVNYVLPSITEWLHIIYNQ